jgi:hypothetical protein
MVAVTYGSARVVAVPAAKVGAPARKGFFSRLMAAMMEARLRQAYREIELHQQLIDGWKDEPTRR